MLEVRPLRKDRKRRENAAAKPRKWPMRLLYLAAAGLLVAGGLAVRSVRPAGDTERRHLIQVGQTLVRQVIKNNVNGRVAAFGEDEDIKVEPLPDHKFMVSGWVDLVSPDRPPERQNFSCVVFRNAGGKWVGEDINIIPQL